MCTRHVCAPFYKYHRQIPHLGISIRNVYFTILPFKTGCLTPQLYKARQETP
jgi:hypothetical protein